MSFCHDFTVFKTFENIKEAFEIVLGEEFLSLSVDTDCIKDIGDAGDELRCRWDVCCNHFEEGLRETVFMKCCI